MSQISDYVDNAGANATDERVLGFAVVATSGAMHASAIAALDAGGAAEDAIRSALREGDALVWAASGEVVAHGADLISTSYRGHIVSTFDAEAGRALLATLRLVDELPFVEGDEAAFARTIGACADLCVHDVRAGAALDALLGADVESRLDRLEGQTSSHEPMCTRGDAVIVVDRTENVAITTRGALPFIVDRAGKPWLVAAMVGESVLAPMTLLHAVIDRTLPLEDVAPSTSGLLLASITHELYREAFVDGAIEGASAVAERGDPPPKAPMPARGQNFTIGPAGHDG